MESNSEKRYGYDGFSPNEPVSSESWSIPKPEVMASPSYWPFVLAFGTALMGLGVLTSILIVIIGILFFILAIVKWMGELFDEQR